jgi:hypothetical protein
MQCSERRKERFGPCRPLTDRRENNVRCNVVGEHPKFPTTIAGSGVRWCCACSSYPALMTKYMFYDKLPLVVLIFKRCSFLMWYDMLLQVFFFIPFLLRHCWPSDPIPFHLRSLTSPHRRHEFVCSCTIDISIKKYIQWYFFTCIGGANLVFPWCMRIIIFHLIRLTCNSLETKVLLLSLSRMYKRS